GKWVFRRHGHPADDGLVHFYAQVDARLRGNQIQSFKPIVLLPPPLDLVYSSEGIGSLVGTRKHLFAFTDLRHSTDVPAAVVGRVGGWFEKMTDGRGEGVLIFVGSGMSAGTITQAKQKFMVGSVPIHGGAYDLATNQVSFDEPWWRVKQDIFG